MEGGRREKWSGAKHFVTFRTMEKDVYSVERVGG